MAHRKCFCNICQAVTAMPYSHTCISMLPVRECWCNIVHMYSLIKTDNIIHHNDTLALSGHIQQQYGY